MYNKFNLHKMIVYRIYYFGWLSKPAAGSTFTLQAGKCYQFSCLTFCMETVKHMSLIIS